MKNEENFGKKCFSKMVDKNEQAPEARSGKNYLFGICLFGSS